MASPTRPTSARIHFGLFELDPAAGTIHKGGIPIKLQPQPYRVLLLLIANAGQVVSREKIQQHLWGDSTFGLITSTLGNPRHGQLGVRFEF